MEFKQKKTMEIIRSLYKRGIKNRIIVKYLNSKKLYTKRGKKWRVSYISRYLKKYNPKFFELHRKDIDIEKDIQGQKPVQEMPKIEVNNVKSIRPIIFWTIINIIVWTLLYFVITSKG